MVKVRIDKLYENATKSNPPKKYWSVEFEPKINNSNKASVWDEALIKEIVPGKDCEVEYSLKGVYTNFTSAKMMEPEKEAKKATTEETMALYTKCREFIANEYKELLRDPNFQSKIDFSACVNTVFITLTRREK